MPPGHLDQEPVNGCSQGVALRRTSEAKAVSRHVGEFASERVRGPCPDGAPLAMNDLDTCPWSATPQAPT
jgi:hypothetical protein